MNNRKVKIMSNSNPETEGHKPVFKGVWIPAEIWEHYELSWPQKILWATISSLGRGDSPCFAGNDWLATRLDSSPKTIANNMTVLRDLGFIKDVGFDGRNRKILAVIPLDDINDTQTGRQNRPLIYERIKMR